MDDAPVLPLPLIRIVPSGNIGNRMLQHLLATIAQRRVPAARIVGSTLPEWGIMLPDEEEGERRMRKLSGHVIAFDEMVERMRRGKLDGIRLTTPSSRLEYFEDQLDLARSLFHLPRADDVDWGNALVIHVRLNKMSLYREGVTMTPHRDYPPMPIAWYDQLREESGRELVFVGEFGADPISQAIQRRYAGSRFIRNADPMVDWRLLYSAEQIAISPSTFSWLAAWLSPYSRVIHVPVAGMLNPEQRPDVDLLPRGDPRCRFWGFPVCRWTATAAEVEAVISGPGSTGLITADALPVAADDQSAVAS